MSPGDRPMLTVAEVAARWGVNVKTIYDAVALGQLPAVRLGRRGIIRIPRSVVESAEKQGRVVLPGGSDGSST